MCVVFFVTFHRTAHVHKASHHHLLRNVTRHRAGPQIRLPAALRCLFIVTHKTSASVFYQSVIGVWGLAEASSITAPGVWGLKSIVRPLLPMSQPALDATACVKGSRSMFLDSFASHIHYFQRPQKISQVSMDVYKSS